MTVLIQEDDFQPDGIVARHLKTSDQTGAVVTFNGIVRQDPDGSLRSMILEHYPAMARAALEDLEARARARFDLDDVVILHRHGTLSPGDRIMMVATASAHREQAFAAAEFLMDYLKTDAPFWKKEDRGGRASWVAARAEDDARKKAWGA